MVLGMKSAIKSTKWNTIFESGSVDIFKGKKRENVVNLLGALSVIGKAKTSDIAKFVFSYNLLEGQISEFKSKDYERLTNDFNRLLTGRLRYEKHGKKLDKKYPSPVKHEYVIEVKKKLNEKNTPVPIYHLTLKGFFLILCYELNQSELRSIIKNASKISVFFSFIKTIMNNSSLDFVNEIFIKPLRPVLVRSDIFQSHDMDFYFGNFAEAISRSLLEKMRTIDKIRQKNIDDKPVSYFYNKITDDYRKLYPHRDTKDLIRFKIDDEKSDIDDLISHFKKEGIESLMDNVFYYDIKKEDWYESIIEHFYTDQELKFSFLDFAYDAERYLVDKVMQNIQFTYYPLLGKSIPKNPRKRLLRSKSWKRHQKFKKPTETFS